MLGTLFGIVGNSNLLRGNLVFGDSGGISFSNGGRDGGGGGGSVCWILCYWRTFLQL